MFPELLGNDLKEKLQLIGISTEDNSSWYKINKELRLICNVIKHGTGTSYNDLKKLRGDLFKNNFVGEYVKIFIIFFPQLSFYHLLQLQLQVFLLIILHWLLHSNFSH